MFLARNGRGLRPRPGASRLVAKRQKRRSVAELEGKIPSRSLVRKATKTTQRCRARSQICSSVFERSQEKRRSVVEQSH